MTLLLKSIALAALICAVTAAVALAATITGTAGNDTLIGTPQADTISALDGNDVVFGLAGNDTIDAGNGDDAVYGDGRCPAGATDASYCSTGETAGDGDDAISGGDGNDRLFGQGGNDAISGGNGADFIDGGSGKNALDGGDGADTIIAGSGPGPNGVFGGDGNDTINARNGVKDFIACGNGVDTVYADRIDAIRADCERVVYAAPVALAARYGTHARAGARTRRARHSLQHRRTASRHHR